MKCNVKLLTCFVHAVTSPYLDKRVALGGVGELHESEGVVLAGEFLHHFDDTVAFLVTIVGAATLDGGLREGELAGEDLVGFDEGLEFFLAGFLALAPLRGLVLALNDEVLQILLVGGLGGLGGTQVSLSFPKHLLGGRFTALRLLQTFVEDLDFFGNFCSANWLRFQMCFPFFSIVPHVYKHGDTSIWSI